MTTKLPGLPRLPAKLDPETKRYLQALGELVEIRLGRRGVDALDRAITARELIQSGIVEARKTASSFDPNNVTDPTNLGFSAPTPAVQTGSPTSTSIQSGLGTPEGSLIAPVGSLFLRTDGVSGATLYIKETGSGNSGWVQK